MSEIYGIIGLMMQNCGDRIKFLRELVALSRVQFEQTTGFNRHTLRAWEGGVNPIDSKTANTLTEKLKEKFGLLVTPQWLIFGTGLPPRFSKEISQIDKQIFSDLDKKERMINELDEFKKNPNSLLIMQNDESMLPQIEPGDFIGGIICSIDDIKFNKVHIVHAKDYTLVRQISKSNDPMRLLLEPYNRNFDFHIIKHEDIIEIAKVVLIRQQ